jgi:hypothetical protein
LKSIVFQRFYACLLQLYPTHFRDEFATEMQAVFSASLEDVRKQEKRIFVLFLAKELVAILVQAVVEHLVGWGKIGRKEMITNTSPSQAQQNGPVVEPPTSAMTILLGFFPILLLSLATILAEAGNNYIWAGLVPFPILYFVILVVAGVAWYQGSPRWSYSYTGFLLVFTWYLEGFRPPVSSIAGFRFPPYGDLWGKWIWLPLLVTVLIVLVSARSWRPLRQFFQNIRADWTLYTFLLYSTLPWLSWALFDEIRNQTLVVISLLVADLSFCLGAWFYLRVRTLNLRALSLFYSMLPACLITVIATSAYWHGRQESWMMTPGNGYADALRLFIFYAIILLIMFFPALASLVRRKRQIPRPA